MNEVRRPYRRGEDEVVSPEALEDAWRKVCRTLDAETANILILSVAQWRQERKRLEMAEAALEEIVRWADAYPLDIFPEPDFKKVRQLLEAGGITLDSVSASNMRYVVEGVGKIARAALAGKTHA